MYTIRVENVKKDWWSVYPAREYHVSCKDEIIISTINDTPDGEKRKDITLATGQVAYVMNGSGQTVDTIRARRANAS